MKKEETEKKIKEFAEAKCQYPIQGEEGKMQPCGKDQMVSVSLPIINTMESGKIETSEGMQIPVPFCEYHMMLAMGGLFGIKTDDKLDKYQLGGPLDFIHVAEVVFNAMAMSGRIEEILEAKKKGEVLANVKTN